MLWKRRNARVEKVPLDGDQLARLINMSVARGTIAANENQRDDLLSELRSVRSYLLREDRDGRRRALNHWFWRVDHYKQHNAAAIAMADSQLHADCIRNYTLRLAMNRFEDDEHTHYRFGMFVAEANAVPAIGCNNETEPVEPLEEEQRCA